MKDNVSRQIKLVIVLFRRGSGWQTVRLNSVTSKPLRVREQLPGPVLPRGTQTRTRTLPQLQGLLSLPHVPKGRGDGRLRLRNMHL